MNWKDYDKLYGDKICKDYLEGKSLKDLAFEYYGSQATKGIKNILLKHNIKLRNINEYVELAHNKHRNEIGYCGRKYTVDVDFFKELNKDSAYILGFIYADGNIYDTLTTIAVQKEDEDILTNIKEKLKYTGKINKRIVKLKGKEYESSILAIRNKDIVTDLKKLGVTEKKSLNIDFPNIPKEYEIDFIRGYFDGDGSIGIQYPKSKARITKTCQIRVRFCSGSEKFIKMVRDILSKYGVREVKVTTRSNINIFEICYSTKDSLKLYELFYKDDCLYLNRKRKKFEEAIAIRNEDIKNTNGHIKVKM